MIKKVLKINGAVVLTKKQRANVYGGEGIGQECPSTRGIGVPRDPCTSDEECFNVIRNTVAFCDFGCCVAMT
ncbi:hypothetical protein [Ascidiimonas aurantiaca]|uniref:hypothetical protein n=1 Tax=Ascidiimonas aurantiaca TaxID=1685432 RepID=UPI0030EC3EC3